MFHVKHPTWAHTQAGLSGMEPGLSVCSRASSAAYRSCPSRDHPHAQVSGSRSRGTKLVQGWLAEPLRSVISVFMALFYPCPLSRCKVARNARIATLSSGGA